MSSIALLIISLGVVLLGSEVFVNGIEWLGKKLNLSEGAVGSVLAAVGTALPETIIPLIAILFTKGQQGNSIGIGAILGAPLMLSTLAMFVTGMAVLIFSRRRRQGRRVVADYSTMMRDLRFFLLVYATAILTGLIPPSFRYLQLIIAGLMILSYVIYVQVMISEERDIESDNDLPNCYFAWKKSSPSLPVILFQVLVALGLIVLGARMFVNAVQALAILYNIPAFVLAIIITPIATELPEKFNSVIWVSREKDTLALGNITGAMVFQSALIPALGIFLTPWQLGSGALVAASIALLSAGLIYMEISRKRHVSARTLLMGGLMYLVFIGAVYLGWIR
ncbi:MAG TPA: sodium:calcium antiporter [Syntrophomonadaceae bacterium]|nr:sodium:calcium antiporter [Syntrophomonadaceae bacterium]